MSLSSSVSWEVRPSVGASTNGGAFDPSVVSPGTDYSQQNSAQYSGTDGTAAGTAAFTSVSHSFVSADVGNLVNIASGSGFTAGFYTIVSVAGGTATLDRSPGTGTVAHYAVGGALDSFVQLVSRAGYGSATMAVPGNTIWVKSTGPVTITTAITNYDLTLFTLIGYASTRGDSGQATLTTSTNSINLFIPGVNGMLWRLKNFIFSSTAGTPGGGITDNGQTWDYLTLENCVISGFSYGFVVDGGYFVAINTEIKNCTTAGIYLGDVNATQAMICGCYIHGNANGIIDNLGATCIWDSVVAYNTSNGYQNANDASAITGTLLAVNSVFYGNTADGIRMYGTGSPYGRLATLINCIIANNGAYGVAFAGGTSYFLPVLEGRNNAYRNNTSGNVLHATQPASDITLTADPFTSASTGDFTLNSTAGGGAACKVAGYQSNLI